ncbi:MAG: hypothetical protein ABSC06_25030 [Rhodopila sp.]
MDAVSRRLPPGGDPGQRLVEDLSRVVDRLEAAAEAITAVPPALLKVGETAAARPVEMSGQQVDKLGRQLAAACNAWAGSMVRESQRKSLAIVAGAGVGIALAFFGAGFGVHWWRSSPRRRQKRGGIDRVDRLSGGPRGASCHASP